MIEATQSGPVEALLTRARKRIETPEAWTQHLTARASDGLAAHYNSASAVAWCSVGTMWAERDALKSYNGSHYLARQGFNLLSEAVGHPGSYASISISNDDPKRTHPEVLGAFDRAIALARERGL